VIARLVAESGLDAPRADHGAPVPQGQHRLPGRGQARGDGPIGIDSAGCLPPDATVDTDHGVRLEFPDASWTLVRPSGTEPYVRIYAESDEVDELIADVEAVVGDVVAAVADAE